MFFSKFLKKINVFIRCVKKNILVSTYIIHSFLPVKQLHVNTTMKMFTDLNLRSTNVIYILNEYTYHLHYNDQLNTSFLMGGVS